MLNSSINLLFKIGDLIKPIFITAEIGINHNGDMSICKKLIDVVKESGCDAVKFQKRDIDQVYTKDFLASHRDSPWVKLKEIKNKVWNLILKEYQQLTNISKQKY